MSNLLLSVMGAFAEFERALIKERQREDIAIAKQKGVYSRRSRKKQLTDEQIAKARHHLSLGKTKVQVARELGLSRPTLYKYLLELGKEPLGSKSETISH